MLSFALDTLQQDDGFAASLCASKRARKNAICQSIMESVYGNCLLLISCAATQFMNSDLEFTNPFILVAPRHELILGSLLRRVEYCGVKTTKTIVVRTKHFALLVLQRQK